MIITKTKKVFTTTDGLEFKSLQEAQLYQLGILMQRIANPGFIGGEADAVSRALGLVVDNSPEVVAILTNRKPRKDRGTKRAKAKPAKPAEKETKAMAGITFGRGGVTKEQP